VLSSASRFLSAAHTTRHARSPRGAWGPSLRARVATRGLSRRGEPGPARRRACAPAPEAPWLTTSRFGARRAFVAAAPLSLLRFPRRLHHIAEFLHVAFARVRGDAPVRRLHPATARPRGGPRDPHAGLRE